MRNNKYNTTSRAWKNFKMKYYHKIQRKKTKKRKQRNLPPYKYKKYQKSFI